MKLLNFIFYYIILNFGNMYSMEAPEPIPKKEEQKEIPLELRSAYDAELKKFQKLHLNEPEKFLEFWAERYKKDKDINFYLAKMQLLASALYWQDQAIRTGDVVQFLANQSNLLFQMTWKMFDLSEDVKVIKVAAEEIKYQYYSNFDVINTVLADPELHKKEIYTPQELKKILALISDSKAIAVTIIGMLLFLNTETRFLNKIKLELNQNFFNTLYRYSDLLVKYKLDRFVVEKIVNLTGQLGKTLNMYSEKKEKIEKIKKTLGYSELGYFETEQVEKDYSRGIKKITDLYEFVLPYYQKFYQLIRQEITNTVREQLSVMLKEQKEKKAQEAQAGSKAARPISSQLIAKTPTQYLALIPAMPNYPKNLPERLEPYVRAKAVYGSNFIAVDLANKNLDRWIKRAAQEKETKQKIKKSRRRRGKLLTAKELLAAAQQPEEVSLEAPLITQKIAHQADDGSYILEGDITENKITIYDPKNNAIITLFKTNAKKLVDPRRAGPINYTEWVKMWFFDPKNALEVQGYLDPNSKKYTQPHMHWFPVAIHSFARLVDDYIFDWGTATLIPSRRNPARNDYLITIAGTMEMPDGSEKSGIFSYLVDSSNGQWYHRMFEPQEGSAIINSLFQKGYFSPQMSGYYDVAFPPLGSK